MQAVLAVCQRSLACSVDQVLRLSSACNELLEGCLLRMLQMVLTVVSVCRELELAQQRREAHIVVPQLGNDGLPGHVANADGTKG